MSALSDGELARSCASLPVCTLGSVSLGVWEILHRAGQRVLVPLPSAPCGPAPCQDAQSIGSRRSGPAPWVSSHPSAPPSAALPRNKSDPCTSSI